MKKLMLVVVVLIVGLWIGKNLLAKLAVTNAVKAITGVRVDMRGMEVGVLNTRIGIRELKVMNPPAFPDPVMIDMPEVYVDYDLAAFLTGRAHLEEVRLHLAELEVIRNKDGQVNLQSLNVVKTSQGKPVPPKEGRKAKQMPFQIDRLHLQIGRVVYKDYSLGPTPQVQEFPVNIDRSYEHITDPMAFGSLVISEALMRTAIGRLPGGAELTGIANNLQQAYSGAVGEAVNEAVRQVQGLGQGVGGSANKAVKETTESLKKLLPIGN